MAARTRSPLAWLFHRVAGKTSTHFAGASAQPATCLRAAISTQSLRSACSSTDGSAVVGGRRRRQAKPCLKELAVQECLIYKATGYSPNPMHQTLPAFVRKFVLRHPSAAELLHEFDHVYVMVLQCSSSAEEGSAEEGAACTLSLPPPGEPTAPAPAGGARAPRLLDALTPQQRAAAHLCRVGEDDFYLMGFVCATVAQQYEDPSTWVTVLYVPPALRGQGVGRGLLDRMTKDIFDGPVAVSDSVVDSVEHWG